MRRPNAAAMVAACAPQEKQCSRTAPVVWVRGFQVTDSDGLVSGCSGQEVINACSPRLRMGAPLNLMAAQTMSNARPGVCSLGCIGFLRSDVVTGLRCRSAQAAQNRWGGAVNPE